MARKSFCRICTSMCGLSVEVEGDQVLSVRGDTDNPLTEGYCCAKGRSAGVTHHREDRLLYPLMARNGVQERVSWDEALDDIAGKLRAIIDEHGPDAVGFFCGGGSYLDAGAYQTQLNMRQALGTRSIYSDMSIDVMSKGIVGEMVAGFGGASWRPDLGRTPMVLYVGTNPVISHGHTSMLNSPTQRLREMTAYGEVWVMDPRLTETGQRATRQLHTRAGSDFVVLGHAIRELLRDGADWAYLHAHARDMDKFAAVVEPFTQEYAARASGLTREELADFVAAIRRNGKLSVETGTGISMSPAGNLTCWMALALMIVTGSLDVEGGAWANPGFFLQLDQRDIPSAPPEGWRGPGPKSRPERLTVAGEYVCAAMKDEIEAGNLRALINLSGHILTCFPDADGIKSALQQLEVLVSVDIIDNTMTKLSTHALPAKDQLERCDLSLAVDPSYTTVGAEYTPAMVAPRGEVRSFWWILGQIGKRLGLDFFPGIDVDTATDDEVIALIAAQQARVPIDTTGEGHYIIAHERLYGWMLKRVDEMGGFRMAPDQLVEQLNAHPPIPPLVQISRRQRYQHNSRKVASDRDTPNIYVNPEDARERGLEDGDMALLESANGFIEGQVKFDTSLVRGALSVPHGWEGQYNVNRLTSGHDVDSITGMPIYSNLPVELTKIGDNWKKARGMQVA